MGLENKVEEINLAKKNFKKDFLYGSLTALLSLAVGYQAVNDSKHLFIYGLCSLWLGAGSALCFYAARNEYLTIKKPIR